ncbi:DNA-directed RNA polymerase subunit beta [Gracilibacillus oryzae]|uniref:DNA-directed RNA polymerase subunit beta n=1 Tax=Gracilibacillus oryzae TaxID=1672701 RepID=A0A7C8GQN5_9BACI|nr:DNA-directed RNA polymerase subunit beta [Gracilibacillus oryzae]KAB8126755.1 DNA-directed RNA polymerase subunit beta [Gracilibacillus oryzae]
MSNENKSEQPKRAQVNKRTERRKERRSRRRDRRRERSQSKQYVGRLIPVWLKLLIIIVLSLFALFIGLIIGFSIIGDGQPLDVLRFETWEHIIDFVRIEE